MKYHLYYFSATGNTGRGMDGARIRAAVFTLWSCKCSDHDHPVYSSPLSGNRSLRPLCSMLGALWRGQRLIFLLGPTCLLTPQAKI